MRVLCALAVVCLLVRVELSSAQQCPADFRLVNNMCYKFSTSNAPRDQAVSVCAAMGARLLAVRDATQQQAVENLLSFEQAGWDYTWTSLKETKTIWRWSFSSEPVEAPQCFTRRSGSALFELSFLKTKSFTLASCTDSCVGWLGSRFKMAAVTMKPCTNEGADCLNGEQAACYCGFSDITPEAAVCNSLCPGDITAVCGGADAFYSTMPDQLGWAPGQPDTTVGNELCMGFGYGHQFQWIATPCSASMRYACQYNTVSSMKCKGDGNLWFSAYNLCFSISSEAYNWYEAQALCKSDNGKLLLPLADETFRRKLSYIVPRYNGTNQYAVFDLWTAGVSTGLTWEDAGNPVTYTNFAALRPDISMGECTAISRHSSPGPYMWDSRPCQESHPYICETEMSSTTASGRQLGSISSTSVSHIKETTTRPAANMDGNVILPGPSNQSPKKSPTPATSTIPTIFSTAASKSDSKDNEPKWIPDHGETVGPNAQSTTTIPTAMSIPTSKSEPKVNVPTSIPQFAKTADPTAISGQTLPTTISASTLPTSKPESKGNAPTWWSDFMESVGSSGADTKMDASMMSPMPNSTTLNTATPINDVTAGGPHATTSSFTEDHIAAHSDFWEISFGSKIALGVTAFAVVLCITFIVIFSLQKKRKTIVELNPELGPGP